MNKFKDGIKNMSGGVYLSIKAFAPIFIYCIFINVYFDDTSFMKVFGYLLCLIAIVYILFFKDVNN